MKLRTARIKALLVGMPLSQLLYGAETTDPPVPLAAGYIAAFARADPTVRSMAEVSVLRYVVGQPVRRDDNNEELFRLVMSRCPDVVGFSCYLWNIEIVAHVTQLIKKVAPEVFVVWGGPEVGFGAENALGRYPYVDAVAAGEGEQTFVDLIKHRATGSPALHEVPGIAYRGAEGGIERNGPRAVLQNLDEIPSPYLTGTLDPGEEPEGNRMLIETYRECPFRCGFCTSPGIPRRFSMGRIRGELEFAHERGVAAVMLADPLFNLGRKRLTALADIATAISPERGMFSRAILMAELLDPASIEQLQRLRIRVVDIGLQSTNPEVLRTIRRSLDLERYREAVGMLQEAGILVNLQTIAGLPGDDLDGLKRTLEFAQELQPRILSCFSALLLEGSYLWQQRERLEIAWDDRPPHRILSHHSLDYEQMQQCLEYGHDVMVQYQRSRRLSATQTTSETPVTPESERRINPMTAI